ncbi:hypothetical protein TWF730_007112 [Orbilia blumenaviensis]|uniref:tyrosinase n=1 Tax=Orbilia blumenaviensis TaxID=1796055 RepID=A0AAV9VJN4_9PEZI
MAVWSSLKYAAVASCAFGLTQVEGLPTVAPGTATPSLSEWANLDSRSVFARQNNIITTGAQGTNPTSRTVAMRKEIRQMIRAGDRSEFNLFLLALRRMQTMSTNDPMSYYQIAGIHGRPYQPWGGVPRDPRSNANTGYCTHSDVIFLPWHRPYLALFEQSLWSNAAAVVEEIRQAGRTDLANRYNAVLPNLRLPYWDWANDASVPSELGLMQTIQVETARGQENIPNPLYSYRFQTRLTEFTAPFNGMTETFRYPARSGNGYVSQGQAFNTAMRNNAGTFRNRVYALFGNSNFNSVGTRLSGRDSLEGVHDSVHGTIGASGHMGFVDNAAFDPVFWLHHANMDRLFALWQGINVGGYTLSGRSSGTYAIPNGTPENMQMQMPPFRATANSFHTPAGVTNTEVFGYSYSETFRQDRASIIGAINRLYSNGTPSGNLVSAVRAAKLKRSLGQPLKKRQDVKPSDKLNTPPSPDALTTVQDKVVENNKYMHWEADVKVSMSALKSSFNVLIFLGDVPAETKDWATSKNLVGTHSVITNVNVGAMDSLVSGTVPLTSSLLNKVVTGDIKDLEVANVVPYLKKNLKCRVSLPDGKAVDVKTVEKLTVQITESLVTLPASEGELPKFGDFKVEYDAVDVPKGNFGA